MTGMDTGELDSGFVGLSTAVGQKALANFPGGDLGQLFCQSHNRLIGKQRGGVLELVHLGFNLGGDTRIAMADGDSHDAAKEIQVLVALGVPQVLHAGVISHQRFRVISADGRKEVLLMLFEYLFFGHDES